MLPAEDGDCLLVQANDGNGSSTAILIDGGRGRSYASWKPHLEQLLGSRKVIDLLVVTHIDADHIEGILRFLTDPSREVAVSQVWFNGYEQVLMAQEACADIETLSAKQADDLSSLLKSLDVAWNECSGGKAIVRGTATELLRVGQIEITVLTPGGEKLGAVAKRWDSIKAASHSTDTSKPPDGLESYATGPLNVEDLATSGEGADRAAANGSSIGLLLRAFNHGILLCGDCHADDLAAGLRAIGASEEAPLKMSVIKVSHHGAEGNTSRDMLSLIRSYYYAFSTDGRHRDHPDKKVVARILKSSNDPKVLAFNYKSKHSSVWINNKLCDDHKYSVLDSEEETPGFLSILLTVSHKE